MNKKKGKKSRCVHQVRIEYTHKSITAWGGVATVVAKLLERVGFRDWVESSIPIHETSPNAKGLYPKVLAQFLTALVGGDRFAHLAWWGHGVEAIQKAFGVQWLPRNSSTLTRFWGKIRTRRSAEELGEKTRGFARQVIGWQGITEDNLNLDSTVFVRYGRQEGTKRGYNPKKPGRGSHHPLLAFLGSGYVVNLWNRSGDTFSGQNAVAFFRQTALLLEKGFRVRRVLCDSGFYQGEFIEYLESEGFTYIIAVRQYPIIQHQLAHIKNWAEVDRGIEAAEFDFEHLSEKWNHPHRYIVIRQRISQRPQATGKRPALFKGLFEYQDWRYTVLVTNDRNASPEEIWREYRPRANDENVIKDLVEGYGIASFSLNGFWATEAVMVLNALVFHNLIHFLNCTILNPNRPKEHLKTLRSKYFILPAQLGSDARKPVLRVAVRDRALRAKIDYFFERITRLPHHLNCIAAVP